jgi:geranylgeranyl pyrophosphate synthase
VHATFLGALHDELARALDGADRRAVALTLAKDAKRVRPLLLFELATALGVTAEHTPLVRAAAAVELIHTASLIHDDVVDVAAVRRGLPSVNSELGNAAAVLVGDEMLCRALELVGPALIAPCLRAVAEMTHGALVEIGAYGDVTVDDARWREIAAGKTGALFGLCGTLAALLAGSPERAERYREATRDLGVAFQAADDLADLASGGDLEEKNPNLAVLAAVRSNAPLRERLLSAWARQRTLKDERDALSREVIAAGGAKAAEAMARQALEQARAHFGDDATLPGVRKALAAGEGFLAAARGAL